jgi:hypothetical protein
MVQVMPDDERIVVELMLNRFRRLMADVRRGTLTRNDFQAWKVEILVDATGCQLKPRRWLDVLRQYQKALRSK